MKRQSLYILLLVTLVLSCDKYNENGRILKKLSNGNLYYIDYYYENDRISRSTKTHYISSYIETTVGDYSYDGDTVFTDWLSTGSPYGDKHITWKTFPVNDTLIHRQITNNDGSHQLEKYFFDGNSCSYTYFEVYIEDSLYTTNQVIYSTNCSYRIEISFGEDYNGVYESYQQDGKNSAFTSLKDFTYGLGNSISVAKGGDSEEFYNKTYEYEYNASDYPVKRTEIHEGHHGTVTTYEYY